MGPGWWHRASTEERLAQIDGCIEVGMTTKQCAMNLGCLYGDGSERDGGALIRTFASRHGREFPYADRRQAILKRERVHRPRWDIGKDKRAYLAGEPIDFWRPA